MKGHSCRGGRSRCSPKRGPGSRAHQSRAILRRDAIKADGEGRPVPPRPRQTPIDPAAAALPALTSSAPVVRVRQFGDRSVELYDFTPRPRASQLAARSLPSSPAEACS
jgi:hypothetical protein